MGRAGYACIINYRLNHFQLKYTIWYPEKRPTKRPEKHRDNAPRPRFAARDERPVPRANTEDRLAGRLRRSA